MHKFGDEHVRQYRESDGEEGYIWRNGSEIVLLTTKGRKTGEPRTMPLIHRRDEGRFVVVASNGGAADHPGWYKNLKAAPDEVDVQHKADRIKVRPREAEGPERERLWKLMTEVWPSYDAYQQRTDRQLPVVVLEPIDSD